MAKKTSNKDSNGNTLTDLCEKLNHTWEIHETFQCPVIGACLDIDEHRKILKKAGYQTKRLKSYRLHGVIMEHLHDQNRISQKVDNYLKYKYRDSIINLAKLDGDDFFAAWKNAFQSGEVDGIFYVAAARKDLPKEYLEEIFGETHMLCHVNLAEVHYSRRESRKQIAVNQKLAKLLKQEKERNRRLKKENAAAAASLHETRVLLHRVQATPEKDEVKENSIAELGIENQALKERLRKMENNLLQQADQHRRLEREKRKLEIKQFDLQSTNRTLADEIGGLISQFSAYIDLEENCEAGCPKFKLCARRILIVGGMTKMKHLYRQLVESSGAEFDYHDGYMNNGKQNIEARVMRSDLVICPVNCNSHGAALKVKGLCRKHNKPIKMLPSSSLSSISNALIENAVLLN